MAAARQTSGMPPVATKVASRCNMSLWVKLRRTQCEYISSASPSNADIPHTGRHASEGPCVDGSGLARRIFTLQQWSGQPCVRPVSAVLMTAGHNALRGSGPGQQHAFEDAVAHVGCPDCQIDWRCIKCCSPFQPLRHTGEYAV